MNLLERFTSLSLKPNEAVIDYLIRAEDLSSSLDQAGEKISETLLISVVLKGLPDSFDYFKTVHDFSKTKASFSDVEKALKNFANSQKDANSSGGSFALVSEVSRGRDGGRGSSRGSSKFSGACFRGGKPGHRKNQCQVVLKCSFCSKSVHDESHCFQKHGKPCFC